MAVERLNGLLGKIEGVHKTDAAPVFGTDGIQLEEHIWSEIEVDFLEENLRENLAHVNMGRAGLAEPGGRFGHITVTVAMKGCSAAIAAANLPEMDVLFQAAGFSSTVVADTSVTYVPISSGHASATFWAYAGGMLYKLVGSRAQLTSISAIPSQLLRATFEIWGVVVEAPTQVALPTIVYAQAAIGPPVVKNAGLTLNSVDPSDFSSWELDMRTQLATLPRGNDPDGHAGYEIVDYDPHFTTTLDRPTIATFDPYALRKAGTLFVWDIGPIGATTFNKITIDGPKGRIIGTPHSASDGLAMMDLLVRCQHTDEEQASADAVTIVID